MTEAGILQEEIDSRRGGYGALLAEFWTSFSENRGAVYGLFFFIAIVFIAIFADFVAPHQPNEQFRDAFLQPPFWQAGGQWRFPLGTDAVGRDVLSRLIFGSRYSLFIGCIVVSVSLVVGVFLGLCAGYFRGKIDTVIMRVMDIVLAFPSLLLALVLVAVLGPSLINAMIAIAIVQGVRMLRLMFITILPNCMGPLIVQAALSFSSAILDAAALGFLGMGAQPPTPEWGTMLAEAREFILRAWWVVTFPGLAILSTVLAINLMGDGLRDALDPKLKRS
jgi:dipeptide transport system permease protein